MGELWRRLWFLLNRSRFERELQEEMDAHRARKGEAGPRFGNALRLREEAADQWGWAWLDRLAQDTRFALRLLVRRPLFSLAAMTILSLGVGVNLAAFQVLDAVAFSPLPIPESERLVHVTHRSPRGQNTAFSYPQVDFYRSHATALSSAFAVAQASITLGDDETRRVRARFVTTNYFSDLGARPLAGRLFGAADEGRDAAAVIVLAERTWRARFGGDAALIGRPIRVNGHPFTVVGIVPAEFVGLRDADTVAWMPLAQHPAAFSGSRLLDDWDAQAAVNFYARTAEGLSIAGAQQALKPLAPALYAQRPDAAAADEWLELIPAGYYMPLATSNAAALALLAALVSLVLVAACMNLGLLILARTLERDREFSIRLAVGASRARIVRQLLTEYWLLGLAGAALGCLVCAVATRGFALLTNMPPAIEPHFNLRSAAAVIVLATLSALLFGFTPVVQTIRPGVSARFRLRSILIGVQVATASVLLIVSGLMVRGVTHVAIAPLGFDYQQTLSIDPGLFSHGTTPDAAKVYWRALDQRVRAMPGVAAAALTSLPPFGNRVTINRESTVFYGVSRSYFETMRIPLRRGRLFDDAESGVALVNETLARRRWPGQDPIGQRYSDATIVGVVGNARTVRIGDGSATECYRPIVSRELADAVMVVRTHGAPVPLAGTLATLARQGQSGLTPEVLPLSEAFERKLDDPRQFAFIASALGACALLLAVSGLAGMIAFTVSQRTREIGVRVALGARPRDVVRAIGRQFAVPLVGGAVAGSALAAGVGVILSRELFGISSVDPLTHGTALMLFAAVASLAALPSLRRAVRVNPIDALRHE
jgi:predicted permease